MLPDFEVFHLPVGDAGTSCQRLAECLDQLRTWSAAHPRHLPVMVWIEPKDDLDIVAPFGRIQPEDFDLLDAELRAGLGERLFTPDALRGEHPTLPRAVAAGWPPLSEMRGHFVVGLLDSGPHRDAYLEGAANLAGRAMFARPDDPEQPFAAVFKIDDGFSDNLVARNGIPVPQSDL